MAILNVMQVGEECLKKTCKPVKSITPRIEELVQDMFDTMYEHDGVGLAAPQVGILKKIFVIDVPVRDEAADLETDADDGNEDDEISDDGNATGDETDADDGNEDDESEFEEDENGWHSNPIVMINPEILETSGSQTGVEGCLSYMGMSAIVTRPDYVRVAYTDLHGDRIEMEATGLQARCILHENDHLSGKMYMEKAESPVLKNEEMEKYIEDLRKKSKGE